mmetsp:Transcript_6425/g.12733  ORF Transcript_6425/g.12733 Transcript_6425/m.12733 type:complete len:265 (-) Transcript_6425:273-1067(-)
MWSWREMTPNSRPTKGQALVRNPTADSSRKMCQLIGSKLVVPGLGLMVNNWSRVKVMSANALMSSTRILLLVRQHSGTALMTMDRSVVCTISTGGSSTGARTLPVTKLYPPYTDNASIWKTTSMKLITIILIQKYLPSIASILRASLAFAIRVLSLPHRTGASRIVELGRREMAESETEPGRNILCNVRTRAKTKHVAMSACSTHITMEKVSRTGLMLEGITAICLLRTPALWLSAYLAFTSCPIMRIIINSMPTISTAAVRQL